MSTRVLKRLPPSICKAAEKLQNEHIHCSVGDISVAELTRVMSVLLRVGKSDKEIVKLLIDVVNGEDNVLSDFVRTYPRRVENQFNESFVMLVFGFLVALFLAQGLVYESFNVRV